MILSKEDVFQVARILQYKTLVVYVWLNKSQ